MRLAVAYITALLLLSTGEAAPITSWQTATAITNADGSLFSWSPLAVANTQVGSNPTTPANLVAQAPSVQTAAALANQAAATASAAPSPAVNSNTSGQSALMQGISSVISGLGSLFSSYSSPSPAASTPSSSTSSSSSSTGGWRAILGLLLGDLGGSSSANAPAPAVAQTPILVSSSPAFSTISASSSNLVSSSTSIAVQASPMPQASKSSSTVSASSSAQPSSSSSGSSGGSGGNGIYNDIYNSNLQIDQSFAKAILDAHNTDRAAHGVGPLSWSNSAYAYAKNNADNYDCSGVLTHTHGPFGENLAAGFANGPAAVKAWYDEGQTYDYTTHNEYSHFTQVVWKGSTMVGCAYKDCRSQGWGNYIVCEYSPAGNVVGQLAANVLPPV